VAEKSLKTATAGAIVDMASSVRFGHCNARDAELIAEYRRPRLAAKRCPGTLALFETRILNEVRPYFWLLHQIGEVSPVR
jgi:hypothetical protein